MGLPHAQVGLQLASPGRFASPQFGRAFGTNNMGLSSYSQLEVTSPQTLLY
jgi:hypothetical protein